MQVMWLGVREQNSRSLVGSKCEVGVGTADQMMKLYGRDTVSEAICSDGW